MICSTVKSQSFDDASIDKWRRASIDIQMYSHNFYEFAEESQIKNLFIKNKISVCTRDSLLDALYSRRVIERGTAIYFKHENKKYLITARHILYDKRLAFYLDSVYKREGATSEDVIYETIISIPLGRRDTPLFGDNKLINDTFSHTFSDPDTDLAILSLDANKMFSENLDKDFTPITIEDIDTSGLFKYGQDLMVIGYPEYAGILRLIVPSSRKGLMAINRFELVVTMGKYASKYRNNLFLADVTSMPGNSGGPIISNNKLVGIISKGVVMNAERREGGGEYQDVYFRSRISLGTKASQIPSILRALINKMNNSKKS